MSVNISKIVKPVIRLVTLEDYYVRTDTIRTLATNETVELSKQNNEIDDVPTQDRLDSLEVEGFDSVNIPAFYDEVRVIITSSDKYSKYTYSNRNAYFVGKAPNNFGDYADTYFTINGKDPTVTKAYLYKYLDYNDYVEDPSVEGEGRTNNLADLGFVLKQNTTANKIIIKARTYYQGRASDISMVECRIISQGSTVQSNNINTL
jgi:hypothetical protein